MKFVYYPVGGLAFIPQGLTKDIPIPIKVIGDVEIANDVEAKQEIVRSVPKIVK